MIAAVEVILGRAIIVAEVIRVKGATFVEEGIRHIRIDEIIEEIEDTAEIAVEKGAGAAREGGDNQ